MRNFKYSKLNYSRLTNNSQHKFAQNFALEIYNSDSIYTFIPKNACSTLRTSLAIANGCIDNIKDHNWIHENNYTFSASIKSLQKANYTFVILRDPFKRLVSVYLDKIVKRYPDAWALHNLTKRTVALEEMTFRKFIKTICQPGLLRSNIHWRPQIDFLVYEQYDDYFALEEFSSVCKILEEKALLKIYDARELTKHGLDQYQPIMDKKFYDTLPLDILNLQAKGYSPSYESMYDAELKEIVYQHYKNDFNLYRLNCKESNLLFQIPKMS